jgi:hypothetical protein
VWASMGIDRLPESELAARRNLRGHVQHLHNTRVMINDRGDDGR